MERLRQGKMLPTDRQAFEPQPVTNRDAAKVVKRQREVLNTERGYNTLREVEGAAVARWPNADPNATRSAAA